LSDAIRVQLPFYDGTLPEAGGVIETASDAIHALLVVHKLDLPVQHQVVAHPLAEGNIQQFSVEGAGLKIASLIFSDAALASNPAVQQHLTEIVGKPYSRTTIDLFLAEQLRPVYLKQGYLKAKLGPAEVRLTEVPSAKLPEQIPVFVPIATGEVYHFADVQWSGNNVISSIALTSYFGVKPGAIADGMQIEEARSWLWEVDGVIRFKAEASAWTPSAVQLQQVWVDPPARRQGFATRALRDLVRILLERTPVVTLFVRRDNLAAISLYEALEMRLVLRYRSILL